ncbi:MAG TPA: D-aminoacyl-tRNA deacylase [Tepidisphaeraceae bacterium]|nr:D-aminoacyl-tRNA deacylase [Tepidisphaeraceae bacterium]
MIAVVQRVTEAKVQVEGRIVGQIGEGMLVLLAVEREDTGEQVKWIAQKLATLRIFRQGDKYFDADVSQIGGSILLVSNFTVAAETRQGRRPSLSAAAEPEKAQQLFDDVVGAVRALGVRTETGQFRASMLVSLTNDGPVTFIVDSKDRSLASHASP